ncbi:MAG: Phage-related minor tail protein [Massilia sp.]|jgi:hypothetical protein|nr:Phage-related minor tail protein [Gemmatimonadales bacterium]MDB5910454.1 Phage-related minor tail protein [Massilia sp.]
MTDPLQAFLNAIGQLESGGSYTAHNPGGALGKYQVMPSNVGPWTKQALGHSETPAQFLADPAGQEAVARTILGGYYTKYGPEGAAAAWFGGPGTSPTSTKSDGNLTVRQYVAKVMSLMKSGAGSSATPAAPGAQNALDLTGGIGPAISSVTETIKNLVIVSPFIVAGVVLVVVGLAHATGVDAKAKAKAAETKDKTEQAAMLVAMA